MKRIIKKSKFIWPGISLLTLTGVLTSLVGVLFALLSKRVLDIATGQTEGDLLHEGIILFGFLLLQLVLEILQSVLNVRVVGRFNIRFKTDFFRTILQKDYMKITEYHTGELLNRIHSDIGVIANGMTQMLPQLMFYLTKIIACFFAIYVLDPHFAFLCLALGPMIFLTAYFYRRKMKSLHKSCQAYDGKVKSFMQETLGNILVIKSFGCGNAAANQSQNLQENLFRLTIKRNQLSILANIFFYIGLTAGYYFALAWGAFKISNGMMTFGTLTALLQLVGQIQTPFQALSSLFPQYYAMSASAERLVEIEDLPDDAWIQKEVWNQEAWSEICLEDIQFSYDEETVLEHTTFSIKEGEFVVIAGTSGTGKSTLLKIMLGILKPTKGQGSLLMKSGEKRDIFSASKRLFSYVPQGNMIVSGTIRENIAFFSTDVSEEEMIRAAQDAQIWDYIKTLPDGLDTVLGEGGLGLSEGQVQRLSVARAILNDAPVMLLDEATSALDDATEIAILSALKARKDKTCILVSHKKAPLSYCDKVYRFNGKQLVETEKNYL